MRGLAADDPLGRVAAVAVLAAILAVVDAPAIIALPIGIVAVVVLPGYAWSLVFLPRLDPVARAVMTVSLSLAYIIAVAPLLDASPWRLTQNGLVAAVTAATLLGVLVASRRRETRPVAASPMPPPMGFLAGVRRLPAPTRIVAELALGAVLITLIARPSGYTEFFALNAEGFADTFPERVVAGEPARVHLGITNREWAPMSYAIVTSSASTEIGRVDGVTVEPGASWSGVVSFALPDPGDDQEVWIELFRAGEEAAYRTLLLWVDVDAAG